MQTQVLALDIIVTDSTLPGADTNLPQLGAIGSFLLEHPLVWFAVAGILLAAGLGYYSQKRAKSLGGGGAYALRIKLCICSRS